MKIRRTLAEATLMMEHRQSSRLSVQAFCLVVNINLATYYYRRHRLRSSAKGRIIIALTISYSSNCALIRAVRCRMIVLNFTQPEMGGKSMGIICTQGHQPKGKLHVYLEDCILAGYSVFTPGEDGKAVSYTTKGKVKAYVQFKQSVPEGFERSNPWPAQLFDFIAIPKPKMKK